MKELVNLCSPSCELAIIRRVRFFMFVLLGVAGAFFSNAATHSPQVVTETQIQEAGKEYGPLAENRLRAWQKLVSDNIGRPEKVLLNKVNNFFNQARFVSDQIHWKQKDYWATPTELLGTDAGDCEDYVIAKYFTLKALGIPEKKLYLTYVKAVRLKQAHMVLTYFETPSSIPLVLDNINKRILKATLRRDLIPVYSFNGDGLWLSRQRGKGKQVKGGTSKLKNWNQLLDKLKRD